ncbi:MAG: alpha/beta hydrolase family protein [Rhizobacter sp.]
MRNRATKALGALLVACASAGTSIHAAAAPATVEDFFRHPAMSDARMSPDGKLLAVLLVGSSGRRVVGIVDVDGKADSRIVAAFSDADVRSFHWVNDRRLVFDATDLSTATGEHYGAGLYAVNTDGSGFRRLIRRQWGSSSDSSTRIESRELTWNHHLHDTLRDGSDDIIVERVTYSAVGEPLSVALLRVNTVTGVASGISPGAPAGTLYWVVDAKGEPRAALSVNEDKERVHWRDRASGTWTQLHESPLYAPTMWPVAVDGAGNFFVEAPRGDDAGTTALYRYDLANRKPEAEPVLSLSGFDFDGALVFDTQRSTLIGVRYHNDAAGTVWFEPALRALQERVDKLLPATVNALSCVDCAHVLVRAASDRQPPRFLLFDPKEGSLTQVGSARPWIDPKAMAERSFTRIKARDGLEIPTYITRPISGKGPWPAVVLVHGGPWVRGGDWEWEAEAQFLASRGYLVVEPEFRGSTGFGARHFRAGFKQWGLAMQDDLADAALWAVQQGLADRARIAIAGASYGGYATLMGLVRHPELYRCGFEWVGVTDIGLMYSITWSDLADISRRYSMPVRIGDPVKDAAQLEATSPVKQAAKIRQPLLLAYGSSDRRVPLEHGTAFRDAVSAHNKNVEWVVYPEEGHGFVLTKNSVDFWTRVERFLARNLQPAPSAAAPAPVTPGS